MKYKAYARPQTLEEADALVQKKGSVILGGSLWIRMQNRTYACAVDLSGLGLDSIEETPEGIRIGASVSLRVLETSPLLDAYAQGAFRTALSPIVGVQFRNCATLGGSVCGRFGFSDVLTLLSALDASAVFYRAGTVSVRALAEKGFRNDILTHILLPSPAPDAVRYLAQRHSATDFPVMTTSLCLRGNTLSVTVGARPLRAVTQDIPVSLPLSPASVPELAGTLAEPLVFGSNRMASAEYRKHLCRVLLTRSLASL